MEVKKIIPNKGYTLTLWRANWGYRATAVAYMERENLKMVSHENGNNYSLQELKDAMITFK